MKRNNQIILLTGGEQRYRIRHGRGLGKARAQGATARRSRTRYRYRIGRLSSTMVFFHWLLPTRWWDSIVRMMGKKKWGILQL